MKHLAAAATLAIAAIAPGSATELRAECGESGCFSVSAPRAYLSVTESKGIDASTFNSSSFVIRNDSTEGVHIVSVEIDLSNSILPDIVFDPNGVAGDKAAKCFSADSGTSQVGLVAPPNPCSSPFSHAHDNGFYAIELSFTDFDPGETFAFSVDVDPTSIRGTSGQGAASPGSVSGAEMSGAQVSVVFDEGATRTGTLFRQSGSPGGGVIIVKNGPPPAPTIQAVGISSPASTSDDTQTIRVTGTAGETVRLLHIEAALDLNGGNGFDLDPFEANSAEVVSEKSATIGQNGTANINVTLTRFSADAGYNYFRAVEVDDDGSGRTGAASNVVILRLVDGAECTVNSDCADGNPCTTDTCSSGNCQHANNSASCDDGLFCNGSDTCSGGTCSVHAGNPCSGGGACADSCDESANSCDDPAGTTCPGDGNPCTDDVCDGNGNCIHSDNSSPCDDDIFCNGADQCVDGACAGHAGDPCGGAAVCDESGDACVECLLDEHCDDGAFCTGTESCQGTSCVSSGDPCAAGAQCARTCIEDGDLCRDPDGTACEDGNACTADDACAGGTCVPGAAVVCDDGSVCNGAESCDSESGCMPGQPFDCSALDADCAIGTCQDSPFACVGTPVNEGATCESLEACVVNPRCQEGSCVGDPLCDPVCETCNGNSSDDCLSRCGHPVSDPAGGLVVATDALATLQAAVGETECAPCVCDVDASGAVVASDALALLAIAVGAEVPIGCPPADATTTSTTTTTLP